MTSVIKEGKNHQIMSAIDAHFQVCYSCCVLESALCGCGKNKIDSLQIFILFTVLTRP